MKKILLITACCLFAVIAAKAQTKPTSTTEAIKKTGVTLSKYISAINLTPAQGEKLSKILPVYFTNLSKTTDATQKAALEKQLRIDLAAILSDSQIKALLGS